MFPRLQPTAVMKFHAECCFNVRPVCYLC